LGFGLWANSFGLRGDKPCSALELDHAGRAELCLGLTRACVGQHGSALSLTLERGLLCLSLGLTGSLSGLFSCVSGAHGSALHLALLTGALAPLLKGPPGIAALASQAVSAAFCVSAPRREACRGLSPWRARCRGQLCDSCTLQPELADLVLVPGIGAFAGS
jgi:hypothetical protein